MTSIDKSGSSKEGKVVLPPPHWVTWDSSCHLWWSFTEMLKCCDWFSNYLRVKKYAYKEVNTFLHYKYTQNMQKRIKYKNLQSEQCSSRSNMREMIWILPVGVEIRGCLLALCLPSLSFWSLPYFNGSTHFLQCHSEWQWTPKFLLATCLQSSIPPPLPKGSVPSASAAALLLTEEKVKDSLAAKHQSNCKVWLSLTWSPHTVHHPAVPSVQENSSTSTCLQSLSLSVANCAQLVSFPRRIHFSAIMRPSLLNLVITMISEKLVPS